MIGMTSDGHGSAVTAAREAVICTPRSVKSGHLKVLMARQMFASPSGATTALKVATHLVLTACLGVNLTLDSE